MASAVVLFFVVPPMLLAGLIYYAFGRERVPDVTNTYRRDIPEPKLHPVLVGRLMGSWNSSPDIAIGILELARRKWVDLVPVRDHTGKEIDIAVVRRAFERPVNVPLDNDLFSLIFEQIAWYVAEDPEVSPGRRAFDRMVAEGDIVLASAVKASEAERAYVDACDRLRKAEAELRHVEQDDEADEGVRLMAERRVSSAKIKKEAARVHRKVRQAHSSRDGRLEGVLFSDILRYQALGTSLVPSSDQAKTTRAALRAYSHSVLRELRPYISKKRAMRWIVGFATVWPLLFLPPFVFEWYEYPCCVGPVTALVLIGLAALGFKLYRSIYGWTSVGSAYAIEYAKLAEWMRNYTKLDRAGLEDLDFWREMLVYAAALGVATRVRYVLRGVDERS